MTISSTSLRQAADGNGVTLAFTFPNRFLADGDLLVYVDGVLKTLTTHYTVSGAGDSGGGTVTFITAPPSGTDNVVIINDPSATQGLDLVENDALPAEDLETALDRVTLVAQRNRDLIDRAFVLADSDASNPSLLIPSPVADNILSWNSTADGLENRELADISAINLPVPIASGGTGAITAGAARTALGLAIGTDVQAYDVDTAKLDVDQTWTGAQRGTITTDNDGSFDQSVSNNFKCTPTGAAALTFTNHTAGQSGLISFINGSSYAITAAATTYISTADLTKLSTTGTYLISYLDDGTNAYCVVSAALTSAGA